jgi:hypothetical protein
MWADYRRQDGLSRDAATRRSIMRSQEAGSFLAYFDDGGLDDVLEFLLGLIPHY